jgi:hypothetical protein
VEDAKVILAVLAALLLILLIERSQLIESVPDIQGPSPDWPY